jgi:acetyltransferase
MTPSHPSADLLRGETRHPLEVFFAPRSVAVIGASEQDGSVGRTILWNLVSNPFGGTVFPIDEKRSNVLGIKAWPSVSAVPEKIDLAVVAAPAPTVPGVIRECAQAGIRGAIVISAGFRESGGEGLRLEREILEIARAGRMRIIGPDCLGVMSPLTGLNATFAGAMARKGEVAFLSQSGALQTAILDWSLQENVGFSAFVSLGSLLDVGWGDVIDYLGHDGRTKSILIYMESVGNARSFLSAAREVTLRKPIIVLKGGRGPQAARAAASHTGALAGSDEVLTAAFRRTGVLRVDSIADLFYMADTLAKQPRPRGRRLSIVTNAGGPAVLATDALVAAGGEPAPGGPVDLLGSADGETYAKALELAGENKDSDGILAILAPQDRTDPTLTADRLKTFAHRYPGKPVLASWMGGAQVAAGKRLLSGAGIPTFNYPDTASRVFSYMWKYTYNLRGLYETPSLAEEATLGHEKAEEILRAARADRRTLLTELESKRVLATYGIPTVETRAAASVEEAVREAEAIGYPVAVKLHSRTVAHKSDVGGVQLDLRSGREVRDAFEAIRGRLAELGRRADFEGVTVQPMVRAGGYELIVGSSVDPQFGPVLLFGTGGLLVEAFNDRSLALPPLNTTLARRMMEQTKIYRALSGTRAGLDLAALEKLLVRFSQLVVEQRTIAEIEINPLLASPKRLVALDARIVLHGSDLADDRLPVSAIRPYPSQYAGTVELRGGGVVKVRPIRPEDEPRMVQFHGTLSEDSVFYRYAGTLKLAARVAHERLARICFIDYDREMALVAERTSPDGALPEIVAVARLTRLTGTRDAEFALLVSDAVQGRGLGRAMLERLFDVGRDWGLERIVAEILPGNVPMRRICKALGFTFEGETGAIKELR